MDANDAIGLRPLLPSKDECVREGTGWSVFFHLEPWARPAQVIALRCGPWPASHGVEVISALAFSEMVGAGILNPSSKLTDYSWDRPVLALRSCPLLRRAPDMVELRLQLQDGRRTMPLPSEMGLHFLVKEQVDRPHPWERRS